MPDPLSTALSGMLAFQRGMELTGHNIANVNTEGYSRQRADFVARDGQLTGTGFVGSGTEIARIRRVYDDIVGGQLATSTTSFSRFETMNELAVRLDSLLADPGTGLNAELQAFFGAVQDIANDPGSLPTRQALLGKADGLAQRFAGMDRQLGDMEAEVSDRLVATVDEINRLAGSIAALNERITVEGSRTGQPPNDLLDQRDRLVRELSAQVSVTTARQDDGALNLFIGSGQTLVIGTEARELGTRGSEFDPTRLEVTFEAPAGPLPVTTAMSGGRLGGLLDFRAQLLDPARRSLGETAQALALTFNEQHASGMDLYGNLGGEFFGIADPSVRASRDNAGSASATVTLADPGALAGTDYLLEFDGAAWSLQRADDGTAVPMTGSGTAGDPFVAGGLAIVTGGSPAAGDRLLVRPAAEAAGTLSRSLTDPQAIAMAAPTRTAALLSNLGSASISASEVVDRTDPALLATAVIEFTGPSTYSIDGSGSYPYTSGQPITVNGSQFTITGQPAAGDRFTLEANSGASGDNRNGLKLADVQAVGILDGGTISINESYGRLVADVGSATQQVKANLDAQGVVLGNAEAALAAKSGVNLDEEAANLIRYQQAYQAAARIVTVSNTLFDTLLAATRR